MFRHISRTVMYGAVICSFSPYSLAAQDVTGGGTCKGAGCTVELPSNSQFIHRFAAPFHNSKDRSSVPDASHKVAGTSVIPRTVARSGLPHGASPLSIDSGLDDCQFLFPELRELASSCTLETPPSGQSCESYSPSQFTEVVKLLRKTSDASWIPHCTGTLISQQWVLTAAHCFFEEQHDFRPDTQNGHLPAEQLDDLQISADNALTLEQDEVRKKVIGVVIHNKYFGRSSHTGIWFNNDLALIRLESPFPKIPVEIAHISPPNNTNIQAATIAGYGFSDAKGGTFGRFTPTWLTQALIRENGQFRFRPENFYNGKRSFCQGDSGGPLFIGWNRGCHPNDRGGESRPRYLQGVMSYNQRRNVTDGTAIDEARACMDASGMTAVDITTAERHDWICRTTAGEALGC